MLNFFVRPTIIYLIFKVSRNGKKFDDEGITLLPGIEISASGNIHWIFIFDDTVVCEGIPEKVTILDKY